MPDEQRAVIVVSAFFLMYVIFELVRRKRLREEYAWIWLVSGVCVVLAALAPFSWMQYFAKTLGSEKPTAVIFFLGFLALIFLCLQFSVRLSQMTEQIKILGQRIALLEAAKAEEEPVA